MEELKNWAGLDYFVTVDMTELRHLPLASFDRNRYNFGHKQTASPHENGFQLQHVFQRLSDFLNPGAFIFFILMTTGQSTHIIVPKTRVNSMTGYPDNLTTMDRKNG